MSELAARVRTFIDGLVIPNERDLVIGSADPHLPYRETPLFDALRERARDEGLWHLFHRPDGRDSGLTNSQYLPVAIETGRSRLAPLIMNSAGPDSGNIDLLDVHGTEEQKARWLQPLLDGRIRSCFAMTEPDVASSDARNISTRIEVVDGRLRISGRKWWITQAAHADCKVALVVGRLTDGSGASGGSHVIVLVPMDQPGVRVERRLSVFGRYEDHALIAFDGVEVPIDNVLGDVGSGLEIAQERLVAARLHHCMRMVGLAERALQVMLSRSEERTAFGSRIDGHGVVRDAVAESRVDIEMMRGLVTEAARQVDSAGLRAAGGFVSIVKVGVPRSAVAVVERAIQVCGGAGFDDDLPLASLYAHARTLQVADGPDDVHKMVIARNEYRKVRNV